MKGEAGNSDPARTASRLFLNSAQRNMLRLNQYVSHLIARIRHPKTVDDDNRSTISQNVRIALPLASASIRVFDYRETWLIGGMRSNEGCGNARLRIYRVSPR